MNRSAVVVLLTLGLGAPVGATDVKAKKPRLDLRATPRLAFSPVNVRVTAALVGGSEIEDYYCPGLVWEWGDGARSVQESDCPPYEAGTPLERHFTAAHAFQRAGTYSIRILLFRAGRSLAVAETTVNVQEGFARSLN